MKIGRIFLIALGLFVSFVAWDLWRTGSFDVGPEYKLMVAFSEAIQPKTHLIRSSCRTLTHGDLPEKYQPPEGYVSGFSMRFNMYKTQQDVISVAEARRLVVSVTEALTQAVNADPAARPHLDTYPMTSDLMSVSIHFFDQNQISLGNGGVTDVIRLPFTGELEYRRYEIYEYNTHIGFQKSKSFTLHKERYADALDIVKKENGLIPLPIR